jgi:hypothetical protein
VVSAMTIWLRLRLLSAYALCRSRICSPRVDCLIRSDGQGLSIPAADLGLSFKLRHHRCNSILVLHMRCASSPWTSMLPHRGLTEHSSTGTRLMSQDLEYCATMTSATNPTSVSHEPVQWTYLCMYCDRHSQRSSVDHHSLAYMRFSSDGLWTTSRNSGIQAREPSLRLTSSVPIKYG